MDHTIGHHLLGRNAGDLFAQHALEPGYHIGVGVAKNVSNVK